MAAQQQEQVEQQFILRVQDPELATKLRAWLREEVPLQDRAELLFEDSERHGTLKVEGTTYPVTLQNLPALVESYKTLDDANLVKTADVGQVLVVGPPGSLHLQEQDCVDGVTPFMRQARSRHFRPAFTLGPGMMEYMEAAVIEIASGRAPNDWTFHDVEEEYVVDEASGEGRWQPVGKGKRAAGKKDRAAPQAAAAAGSETE